MKRKNKFSKVKIFLMKVYLRYLREENGSFSTWNCSFTLFLAIFLNDVTAIIRIKDSFNNKIKRFCLNLLQENYVKNSDLFYYFIN